MNPVHYKGAAANGLCSGRRHGFPVLDRGYHEAKNDGFSASREIIALFHHFQLKVVCCRVVPYCRSPIAFMTHHVALQFAVKTDTGLVRSHNEDAVQISADHRIAVLADGMGGYNAGEIASSIATSVFMTTLERQLTQLNDGHAGGRRLQQLISAAVGDANNEILDAARNEPQYSGMGTTLVAALFRHDRVVIAHVGDSRCYRFRRGELTLLTRDHSLLQEQIDAGLVSPEWARYAPNKNLITRALGVAPQLDVETNDYQIEEGDVYLLCSDGLSDMLSAEEMMTMLHKYRTEPDKLAELLVQAANDNGGRDNISVILAKIITAGAAVPHERLTRLKNWFANRGWLVNSRGR
jgi:serine/threonine protein phosphatase PrpC